MRLSALMNRKILATVASGLLLTACFGDSDIRPIPVFPTGGGKASPSENRAPEIEETVSMGGEPDWKIADITAYKGNSTVDCVYAVSLYRDNCPNRAEWELYELKKVYPLQALQVQLSNVGSEVLGYEVDFTGQQPTVGNPLIRYGLQEDTFVTRREALQVSDVVGFSPVDENKSIPFQQVSLVTYISAEETTLILQK